MAKKSGALLSLATSPESVKKHVAAIHTDGTLTLLERKMANVLLLNAYDSLLTQRTHRIPIQPMCAMMGWDEGKNTERLQAALRRLASTPIEFNLMEDGKESWQVTSMISFGKIKDGVCTYRYDEYLAERLYDPEVYATINIGVQRQFDSGYALTLYENCARYRSVGSTGWWTIEKFRSLMGATAAMYDEFKYLKREVITKPIDQVNRVSDICIQPDFQKTGRKVTSIRFKITESQQKSLLTPEATDQHAEVRSNPTYQRLVDHGIGDRLALLWVIQNESHASAVLDYVEAKDKKRHVKGSTAGYIRRLIEDKADVGKSAYEEKKAEDVEAELEKVKDDASKKRQDELRADFQRMVVVSVLKRLTIEERRSYALSYIGSVGKGADSSYSNDTAEFADRLEKLKFSTWLRKEVAPAFDEEAFSKWCKVNKGIDLATS